MSTSDVAGLSSLTVGGRWRARVPVTWRSCAVRLVLSEGEGVGGITHLHRLMRALVVIVDGGSWAGCHCRRQWMGGGGGGKTVRDVAVTHNQIWQPAARGAVGVILCHQTCWK
jgi:hypothetical protein